MATRFRLPQYQLEEIERVYGSQVALEAAETAKTEQLTAKQLADRYRVRYMRKMPGEERLVEWEPRAVAPRIVQEGVVKEPEVVVDKEMLRRAKIEQLGRIAYRQQRDTLLAVLVVNKQLQEEVKDALLAQKTGSYKEYAVNMLRLKSLERSQSETSTKLAQLELMQRDGNWAFFLPQETVQMIYAGLYDAVPTAPEQIPMNLIKRIGAGQARIEEFGGPKPQKAQLRLTEYYARRKPWLIVR